MSDDMRVSEAANDAREYWRQKVDYWKARAEAAEVANSESRHNAASSIPHNAVCFFADGDKMCAVFGDFVNLQESPAGFGDDFISALNDLRAKNRVVSGGDA